MDKIEIAKTLLQVLNFIVDVGPTETHTGLCREIKKYLHTELDLWYHQREDIYLAARRLMWKWPLKSDCSIYVVPANRFNKNSVAALEAYDTTDNKWDQSTEYGQLRWLLVNWMRQKLYDIIDEMPDALRI